MLPPAPSGERRSSHSEKPSERSCSDASRLRTAAQASPSQAHAAARVPPSARRSTADATPGPAASVLRSCHGDPHTDLWRPPFAAAAGALARPGSHGGAAQDGIGEEELYRLLAENDRALVPYGVSLERHLARLIYQCASRHAKTCTTEIVHGVVLESLACSGVHCAAPLWG